MEEEQRKATARAREKKSEYADYLKGQMMLRKMQEEEEQKEREAQRAQADLDHDRLLQEENELAQQKLEKMFRLKADIKSQVNAYHCRTDEERQLDMAQAQMENEKARKILEDEQALRELKKEAQKRDDKQCQLAWVEEKERKAEEKREQDRKKAEERQKLMKETYTEPADRAAMRKALTEKVAEGYDAGHKDNPRWEKLKQRQERLQQERNDLSDVLALEKRAAQQEHLKQEKMLKLRRENVDFLKNQISQKMDMKAREMEFEQLSNVKDKDLLQRQEDAERKAQAKKSEARSRYKHDLIEQIEHRRTAAYAMNKQAADILTPLEIAINKELLETMQHGTMQQTES